MKLVPTPKTVDSAGKEKHVFNYSTKQCLHLYLYAKNYAYYKGQLILKAIYGVLESPKKKRMNKIWLDIS